jgi:GNAT superfamily N-acetyltransferase
MITPDHIRIREFRRSDLAPLRRLIHETIDTCYSSVYPRRAVQFFKEFHSDKKIMERSKEGEILVVEEEGALVSTGTIVSGDIFGVFVRPQFQGRGYGRAVMCELEDRAKARGCTEVILSVSLPSRGFYERLGYEMIEACSRDVGEGEHLDFWKARKSLVERSS